MRPSCVRLIHRASPRHRKLPHGSISASLRERIQTSLDGVVRGSQSPQSFTSSVACTSRNGILALLGWIAILSYLEGSAAQPRSSRTPTASAAFFPSLYCSGDLPVSAHSFTTSSTRRLHTSATAKQSTSRRLQDSVLSGSSTSQTPNAGFSRHTARYGSLAQLPASQTSWWERLGLSLLRSSSSSGSGNGDAKSKADSSGKSTAAPRGTGRIYDYMRHPSLYDPVLVPQHPIVLCHGLYGFDVRGPFFGLEIHYWANVLDILRKKVGADVLIHGVPPTGSIQERAEALHRFLCSEEAGVRGKKLNFIGHSMGGLDVRHLITNIKPKPEEYIPISLTTVSTPHRGSPFMDWCNANIGIGNEYIEKALEKAKVKSEASKEPVRLPYSLKTPLFSRQKNGNGKAIAAADGKPDGQTTGRTTGTEATGVAATSAVLEAVDKVADAVGMAGLQDKSELRESIRESEDKVASTVKESLKKKGKDDASLPFGLSSFAKALSSLSGSFSAYMLSLLDTPAYAMLSTKYMAEVFNPTTPNSSHVKYYSVAARTPSLAIWHPLWLPKLILDAAAESRTIGGEADGSGDALGSQNQGNDGLVSVESAKWGEFLGVMEGCDHWDLRGGGAPRWKGKINPATGKPYQSKAEMTRPAETSSASSQKSKKATSWTDINQLLFSRQKKNDAVGSETAGKAASGELIATGVDGPSAAASSSSRSASRLPQFYSTMSGDEGWSGVRLRDPDHDGEDVPTPVGSGDEEESVVSSFTPYGDDTLVADIAAWISERLPQRNDERRAQAEERDRIISQMSLTLYQPAVTGQAATSGRQSSAVAPTYAKVGERWQGSDVAGVAQSSAPAAMGAGAKSWEGRGADVTGIDTTTQTISAASPTKTITTTAAAGAGVSSASSKSERGSGSGEDGPSLQPQPQAQPQSQAEQKGKKKPTAEPDELERFWVALCRHLHREGF